jgi:hypothetical protein
MTRDDVNAIAKVRDNKRQKFSHDLAQARITLHPKNIAERWVDRKKLQIKNLQTSAAEKAKDNKVILGAAIIGIAAFLARKPIQHLISKQTDIDPKSTKLRP